MSLDRKHDVPYLAGSSNDNATVYIDRRVPHRIKVKRANGKGFKSIDPAVPLSIHERSEHRAMKRGKSYEKAHIENGTADERAWVEKQGLDWKHYEEIMDGLLSHIEHEHPTAPPKDLYLKPYPHDKQELLRRAAKQPVKRADGGAVFGTLSPQEEAERPPNVLDKIVSGLGNTAANIVKFPRQYMDAYRPGQMVADTPQATQWAPETALALAGGAAPAAERGAAGIFGGKLSRTADLNALDLAQQMEARGMPRGQIWDATGWFKGADKQWRYEIPDSALTVTHGEGAGLSGPVSHADLAAAYPGLRRVDMHVGPGEGTGRYIPEQARLEVNSSSPREARGIAAHELQHAVDQIEGFAPGGNPHAMLDVAQRAYGPGWALPEHMQQNMVDAANEAYRRLAGETYARTSQNSVDMSAAQRRANPPWTRQDVPDDMMIVRSRANGGAVRMADGGGITFDPSKPYEPVNEAPSFDPSKPFESVPDVTEKPGLIGKALEPITSYPSTYSQMNREARDQMGQGVGQITAPESGAWDVAKGLGNVGLGALNYVASPISAGLRTVVGKPIEEATGIPKEYTEFAAGLALPGIGMTKVPTKLPPAIAGSREAIAEAAQRQNVAIPRAAASESIPIQSTAGALKEVPVVGAPLVKSSKAALADIDQAVDNIVAGYGAGQPLKAGEGATEGVLGWITGKSADIADRLYNRVDSLVDPAHTRELDSTRAVIGDIMAKRANARISGASPAVSEVTDASSAPGGLNYEGIKDLRSYIGNMTPQEMIAKGINKQEAKRIYSALTDDLRATIRESGGDPAVQAFDRANRVYDAISAKRAELAKVIGVNADAAPERVMARIMEMAGSKGGADYQKLVQVRRAIGPEKWDEVTSSIINQMGRDKPGADFSGDRFITAWNRLPENSRSLLFNSTNKPGLAKSIEDIVTLSAAHKNLMRYGNPSGTGRVATLGGMAGALWGAPLPTIASAIGGNMMARVLASPVAAREAAKWSLTYSNVVKNPSPGRMAVLGAASDRLAKAINRDLGATFSGQDFLRPLQGPMPGRADQEQQ